MEVVASIPAFLVAVLIIALAPGPAMALLIRRSARDGFGPGAATVAGVETGLYAWILAAGVGVTALIAASETAYTALRIVGAIVLCWLGFQAWRAVLTGDTAQDAPSAKLSTPSPRRCFTEGLLTNLANPKAAVFVFAFYPQFIPAGYPTLLTAASLGILQVSIEFALYIGLVAGVSRARTWFARPRVRRSLDGAAGTVMIGLGLRLALEKS